MARNLHLIRIITTLSMLVLVTESCKPCYSVVCEDTSSCKDGVVKDMCGCCDVCAKSEGDSCGGLFHFRGECGNDLKCVSRRPNSVKVLGENDLISGICEPSACSNKKCGFNQRCQLNGRGKARCVCPRYCKNRYMPVCGLTNGRHYWNRCFLRKDECKEQRRIGYVDGPCKRCYDNGKTYKFGDAITRKDKCETCTCKHGQWKCEEDFSCRQKPEDLPTLCDVNENNCPDGFYCQEGKYEPDIAVINIGIGFCIPQDEESQDRNQSGEGQCPKLKCDYCRHGYVKDAQGCATCECIKVSSMKNICDRPKYYGPCMAHTKRYYYNKDKGKCIKFNFGGCLSNGNNFSTKKKCEKRCMIRKTK